MSAMFNHSVFCFVLSCCPVVGHGPAPCTLHYASKKASKQASGIQHLDPPRGGGPHRYGSNGEAAETRSEAQDLKLLVTSTPRAHGSRKVK